MGNELGAQQDKDSIFSGASSGSDEKICPKLSYKQRIYGFLGCSVVGFVMSWVVTFVFVFSGFDVKAFAILFCLCQVLNIASSCVLSTPSGHLKAMKKKHRIIPSVLYILMIILTLVLALATNIKGLVLLCVILCTICYYWYTISFIPYGTKILKKVCGSCLDMEKWITAILG